ncbi:MAG: efflux RND transporter periplasmic adaptor subunit, partial [Usitatibacter sp.]
IPPMKPSLAAGIAPALAAAVALAALAACSKQAAPGAAPAAVPARVIEVQPRSVPIVVEGVGQVEGSKEVEVRSRVSGNLKKILYKEGEVVKPGATLFQIDPEPFEIALNQARSLLAQEVARNEQMHRESARMSELIGQRAVSQKEVDDAKSNTRLSDAALQVAQSRVKEAELNLSYTKIDAPVGGVTGRSQHSEGSLISTSGADSLLTTLSQMDPVWVRFSLSESDLAKLPGGKLTRTSNPEIKLVLPDGSIYPVTGRLNFAASQIDPRLATMQLRAEFANGGAGLLPGQFVRVQLIGGQRDNVFLIPQVAVTQTESGYLVFVLDAQGKAELRPVKVGDWVGKDWTILDGLKKGDKVVVDNLLKLRPGSAVAPVAAQ